MDKKCWEGFAICLPASALRQADGQTETVTWADGHMDAFAHTSNMCSCGNTRTNPEQHYGFCTTTPFR